ncbi:MAG: DNA methyltransferase [Cyanobacteria bacterium P01_A01_bin.68]
MSTPRHHAEWLSLVEANGPFLSLPVLLKAFPNGLDAHEPEHFKLLRLAYEEYLDAEEEAAIHRAWVDFILCETLEFPDEVLLTGQAIPTTISATIAEQGETLRPDYIVRNQDSNPRLLIQIVPPGQHLEKPLKDKRWKASPATRMMELLHATNVRLGLVTNGQHWLLVNAPRGETTGFISWYANLWLEENITLRAFRSLLGVSRFFGVDDSETLEALFAASVNDQQEVTDQLGYQVRKAVEVLVQALDRIDQDRNRTLLTGISEKKLYEAALTVMMRLVFLFSAEERGLLLLGDSLYDQYYAVSTLREQLQQRADKEGEEILERRSDAWCRLLATFRAVYGGIAHDTLQLPAYGGSLFNPDRFAFLEGREPGSNWEQVPANPIPVNNRIVLHLLEALQILQIKFAGNTEPRRLSFRALDIEQIGHVYEGLLDHTAVRANSPVLGLIGTKDKEPEIELHDVETRYISSLQTGNSDFFKYLKKRTGRSESAIKKALQQEFTPHQQQRLLIACNNNQQLYNRVLPFQGLIRLDTLEYPIVIPQGSVYVTQGSDRRETGTHYTPKSLTEEIVKYTLEPLVYQGVAEGKPEQQWQLQPSAELLKLKICDMAMGSGAFLVQTCRYLAERLVEAWENSEKDNPGKIVIAPEGELSKSRPEECVIPKEADERLAVARRIVAERCLYGVDKNPLAVEMAKLSLWLITLAKGRPFTFVDHALKCGDSLVGVNLEQLRYWNLDISGTPELFAEEIRREIDKVIELRRKIADKPVMTTQDQTEKEYLLAKANAITEDLRDGCNLLVGSYFNDWKEKEREGLRKTLLNAFREGVDIPEGMGKALPDFDELRAFHWDLEFPEVFVNIRDKSLSLKKERDKSLTTSEGFSAIVGNPPFMGGSKITGALSTDYRDFIVKWIADGKRGSADICAYFFLRAKNLLNINGGFGLIATNTIAQGDTREVGLDQLVDEDKCIIPRAVPSRKWEGSASLEVAHVWLRQGDWQGKFYLDDKPVNGITPFLTVPGKAVGKPGKLIANKSKSYIGSFVLGMGFVMSPEEAQVLIKKYAKNKDVLYPYLIGEDLNSRPDQSPSRWVINFKDYPLDAEHDDPKKPKGQPYAADYPDCLKIVEEKVKPQRDEKSNGNSTDKDVARRWWQFKRTTTALYDAIANLKQVLVVSLVNNHLGFAFAPGNIVFAHRLAVFPFDNYDSFAVLQSNFHYHWAWSYSSTLRRDINYSPSDCFETFPFPSSTTNLETIGEKYHTHRQNIMLSRQEGLTKTYNRFHNPEETATDIQQLRELHVEMDNAVATAYGWTDLELEHGFHDTKQGLRYTISETARREVLDRLLQLNHERYKEEVALGLHDKKKKKGSRKKKVKAEVKKPENGNEQLKLFE